MSQTTVYTSHKIFNIYKYLDWQGRDIYLFVWWHPGEARGLWFPWWGQQPSFCHRFDRAELVCWSIGTTWQIKQCFIVLWMKHIPHHDIDAARFRSVFATALGFTQYHTTAHHCSIPHHCWAVTAPPQMMIIARVRMTMIQRVFIHNHPNLVLH